MTRARGGAIAAIIVLLIGAAVLARSMHRESPKPANKPVLLLLTSLPLVFNEEFSIEGGGSAALTALQAHYRVVSISTTGAADLSKGRLLLMAHPLAQTAENLVELDAWVRNGGRVLILADPMLEWPSKRPLGDPLRPPPMFADTGLLGHWGLTLEAPGKRGPVKLGGGHDPIVFVSPGHFVTSDRNCVLSRADIVADCKIGRGRAIVAADADFLNPAIAALENPSVDNLAELTDLLESLRR